MQFVATRDGSFTIFDEQVKEHQHSLAAGAITEAKEKHIVPLQLQDGMKILDFCFGLGYNSIVATYFYQNLKIIGLEKEKIVLEKIRDLPVPQDWEATFLPFRCIASQHKITDDKGNQISVLLGDALETMYTLEESAFDRIFFDPFSPKKQPEMWTEEVFLQMFNSLKPEGKLSTYSCAALVRKNLKKAGFHVIDGPCIGRKAPATIAIKRKMEELC
jgi:tRNA U34 5-methylaminomethyl-2-thiouridine-forming methyltransferase MnmC